MVSCGSYADEADAGLNLTQCFLHDDGTLFTMQNLPHSIVAEAGIERFCSKRRWDTKRSNPAVSGNCLDGFHKPLLYAPTLPCGMHKTDLTTSLSRLAVPTIFSASMATRT